MLFTKIRFSNPFNWNSVTNPNIKGITRMSILRRSFFSFTWMESRGWETWWRRNWSAESTLSSREALNFSFENKFGEEIGGVDVVDIGMAFAWLGGDISRLDFQVAIRFGLHTRYTEWSFSGNARGFRFGIGLPFRSYSQCSERLHLTVPAGLSNQWS